MKRKYFNRFPVEIRKGYFKWFNKHWWQAGLKFWYYGVIVYLFLSLFVVRFIDLDSTAAFEHVVVYSDYIGMEFVLGVMFCFVLLSFFDIFYSAVLKELKINKVFDEDGNRNIGYYAFAYHNFILEFDDENSPISD